jgi:3D (Asp-Asp-Asp) domain-containing protein
MNRTFTLLLILIAVLTSCENREKHQLKVTATAYNSLPEQTHEDHAAITAWGDTLKPGMKSIAVSRDLIKMGLDHNTEVKIKGLDVKIKGLDGTYKVLDKMNKRWEKKIDIYFGLDREKALEWGKQEVEIIWYTKEESQ